MGTKRIGLARVEALIENLKRDLNLGGTAAITGAKSIFGSAAQATDASAYAAGGTHPDVRLRFHCEEVSLVGVTPNDTDNAILAYLSKKFDGDAIIKDVYMYASEVANSATGGDLEVNLQLTATGNTAAGTAVSSGTEIMGAGVSSTQLAMDTDDTAGVPVFRASNTAVGAKVSIAICDDGNLDSVDEILTAGRVVVAFTYLGKEMIAN